MRAESRGPCRSYCISPSCWTVAPGFASAQGRAQEALDDLQECARLLDAWKIRSPGRIPWRATASLALTALGERDEAIQLASHEVELARRFQVPRELGIALRAAGLAEGGDRGIELLAEAEAVLARSPAVLEHARALTDLGAALRRGAQRRTHASRSGARSSWHTGAERPRSPNARMRSCSRPERDRDARSLPGSRR